MLLILPIGCCCGLSTKKASRILAVFVMVWCIFGFAALVTAAVYIESEQIDGWAHTLDHPTVFGMFTIVGVIFACGFLSSVLLLVGVTCYEGLPHLTTPFLMWLVLSTLLWLVTLSLCLETQGWTAVTASLFVFTIVRFILTTHYFIIVWNYRKEVTDADSDDDTVSAQRLPTKRKRSWVGDSDPFTN